MADEPIAGSSTHNLTVYKKYSKTANRTLTTFAVEMSEILRHSIERLDDISLKVRSCVYDIENRQAVDVKCIADSDDVPKLVAMKSAAKIETPKSYDTVQKSVSSEREIKRQPSLRSSRSNDTSQESIARSGKSAKLITRIKQIKKRSAVDFRKSDSGDCHRRCVTVPTEAAKRTTSTASFVTSARRNIKTDFNSKLKLKQEEESVMKQIRHQHHQLLQKSDFDPTLAMLRDRYVERPRRRRKKRTTPSTDILVPRKLRPKRSQKINECYTNEKFGDELWFGPKLKATVSSTTVKKSCGGGSTTSSIATNNNTSSSKKSVRNTKLARKYANENFHENNTRERQPPVENMLGEKLKMTSDSKQDWCIIMQTQKNGPKYELKQNSPFAANNILDEITLKDLEPIKAEYPRKDHLLEPDLSSENTLLYKLVHNDRSLEYLINVNNSAMELDKYRRAVRKKNKFIDDIPEEEGNAEIQPETKIRRLNHLDVRKKLRKYLIDPNYDRKYTVLPVLVQFDKEISPHLPVYDENKSLSAEQILKPYIFDNKDSITVKPEPQTVLTMRTSQNRKPVLVQKMVNYDPKPLSPKQLWNNKYRKSDGQQLVSYIVNQDPTPRSRSTSRKCATPKSDANNEGMERQLKNAIKTSEQKHRIMGHIEKEMKQLLSDMNTDLPYENPKRMLRSKTNLERRHVIRYPKEPFTKLLNSMETVDKIQSKTKIMVIKAAIPVKKEIRKQVSTTDSEYLDERRKCYRTHPEVTRRIMHKWKQLENPSCSDSTEVKEMSRRTISKPAKICISGKFVNANEEEMTINLEKKVSDVKAEPEAVGSGTDLEDIPESLDDISENLDSVPKSFGGENKKRSSGKSVTIETEKPSTHKSLKDYLEDALLNKSEKSCAESRNRSFKSRNESEDECANRSGRTSFVKDPEAPKLVQSRIEEVLNKSENSWHEKNAEQSVVAEMVSQATQVDKSNSESQLSIPNRTEALSKSEKQLTDRIKFQTIASEILSKSEQCHANKEEKQMNKSYSCEKVAYDQTFYESVRNEEKLEINQSKIKNESSQEQLNSAQECENSIEERNLQQKNKRNARTTDDINEEATIILPRHTQFYVPSEETDEEVVATAISTRSTSMERGPMKHPTRFGKNAIKHATSTPVKTVQLEIAQEARPSSAGERATPKRLQQQLKAKSPPKRNTKGGVEARTKRARPKTVDIVCEAEMMIEQSHKNIEDLEKQLGEETKKFCCEVNEVIKQIQVTKTVDSQANTQFLTPFIHAVKQFRAEEHPSLLDYLEDLQQFQKAKHLKLARRASLVTRLCVVAFVVRRFDPIRSTDVTEHRRQFQMKRTIKEIVLNAKTNESKPKTNESKPKANESKPKVIEGKRLELNEAKLAKVNEAKIAKVNETKIAMVNEAKTPKVNEDNRSKTNQTAELQLIDGNKLQTKDKLEQQMGYDQLLRLFYGAVFATVFCGLNLKYDCT